MTEEQSAATTCISCGCPFVTEHEGKKDFCEECGDGPYCRMCLVMRHKRSHNRHGLLQRVMRYMGWHHCLMCVTVNMRRLG